MNHGERQKWLEVGEFDYDLVIVIFVFFHLPYIIISSTVRSLECLNLATSFSV